MRSDWMLAAAGLATLANCFWPCWQMSAISLMCVALWADENWETLV